MTWTFKTFNNATFQRGFFWFTIFIGLSLPIFLMIVVDYLHGSKDLGAIIVSTFIYFIGSISSIGFLYWFFHGLIFVLLAFLIRSKFNDTSKDYVLRVSTSIGAWSAALGFSFCVNLSIMVSDSSTASLGYIFAPFYTLISILIGNACGWIVGKVLLKSHHSAKR